jgi:hypothetical protein
MGRWDDVVGLVLGPDSRRGAAALVESSRRPAPVRALPPRLAAILDDAQARGDSFIYVVDFQAAAGKPASGDGLWTSLGTAGATLHLRTGISAAQARAMASP